jgi:hypothetical protein
MRGRVRFIVLAALLAALLAVGGCTGDAPAGGAPAGSPTGGPLVRTEEPGPVSTAMSDDMLCWAVNDAIRRIVTELMAAPNTDDALIAQTVESYRAYAATLREIAVLADTDRSEQGMNAAAEAAESYAQKVFDENSYRVDISGVIEASRRALPACDLEG